MRPAVPAVPADVAWAGRDTGTAAAVVLRALQAAPEWHWHTQPGNVGCNTIAATDHEGNLPGSGFLMSGALPWPARDE